MKTKWILTLLGICYMSNLVPAFASDVLERAQILGHSVEDIKAGKTVSSVVTVKSAEQLKSLTTMCQSTPPAVAEAVSTPDEGKAESSGLQDKKALQKKLDAYLFNGRPLTDDEKATINRVLFPLKVYTESAQNATYNTPTFLNQTPTSYLYYNYGTVTLNNNASVTVQSSQLCYAMDTLVKNSTPPSGTGDFNVVGIDGQPGTTGKQGNSGTAGGQGGCGGCYMHGTGGKCQPPGYPGQSDGTDGGPGGQGNPGTPNESANFYISGTIQTTAQNVIFQTSTGMGGTGGIGGTGGAGGAGGIGANGTESRFGYCCRAGDGGPGGNGMTGGTGGNGGTTPSPNGDVTIYAQDQYIDSNFIQRNQVTVQAPAGAAGLPGPAGAGGSGGNADGGPCSGTGSRGRAGAAGSPGQPGNPGNSVPSAQIQLFPI